MFRGEVATARFEPTATQSPVQCSNPLGHCVPIVGLTEMGSCIQCVISNSFVHHSAQPFPLKVTQAMFNILGVINHFSVKKGMNCIIQKCHESHIDFLHFHED